MRLFSLALVTVVLAVSACARPAPVAADGCGLVQAHPISFSGASTSDVTAGDTVEARSFGPDCAKAIVALTIRAADGSALWTFAAPARTVFPETAAGAIDPTAATQAMGTLLRRWARVTVSTTSVQPRWAPMSAAPGSAPPEIPEGQSPMAPWSTPFDEATYASIRDRGLPMACFETSPDTAECVYWEAAAGEALLFLAFKR